MCTVLADDCEIRYHLERKTVKNLNLRIKRDGTVFVSAHSRVPVREIDRFVQSKAAYIQNAIRKFEEMAQHQLEPQQYHSEAVFRELLNALYPRFVKYGVARPTLRIRDMKSRWGSCLPTKGIITLNKQLLAVPLSCIEYVVMHELCHFLHPNHSKQFYTTLAMLMPDWKERKQLLNQHWM